VRILGVTPSSQRVTVHRTHLPLLLRGSLDSSSAWASSDPRFSYFHDPSEDWLAELRQYQKDDSTFISQRHGTLLAQDLGLGKTRTAIAGGLSPYLILAPKTGISVWQDELDYAGMSWRVLEGRRPSTFEEVSTTLQEAPAPDAFLLSYHVADSWLPYFCELGPAPPIHTLICDEAHYLQKSKLQWAKAVRRVRCVQRILLTATPLRNRLVSLWALLDAVNPGAWGSLYDFRHAYCAAVPGEYGLLDGEPSEEVLKRLGLRLSEVVIKRTRASVGQELPPLSRKLVPVGLPVGVVGDTVRNAVPEDLRSSSGTHLAWATEMRQQFGLLKVDRAVSLVDELLPHWGRAVLWVWHDAVVERLRSALGDRYDVDLLLGKTTQLRRDKVVREWRDGPSHPPKGKVLIASIGAASSAISLTSCGLSIFVEQDWAPLQMQQSEARTHRFGQRHPECLSLYLCIPGTIDGRVAEVLLEKASEAERVLGVDGQSDQMRVLLGEDSSESTADFMRRIGERIIKGEA
jgi:hypothetical protein